MTIYKEEDPSKCIFAWFFNKFILLDYKFYDKLGKGSSGLVYKAEKLIKNEMVTSATILKQSIDFSSPKGTSSAYLKQSTSQEFSPTDVAKSDPGYKSFPQKRESSYFVDCAIKIIKLDKDKMFDRLKCEIAIMKMCRHDNIVMYYETFKHMQ